MWLIKLIIVLSLSNQSLSFAYSSKKLTRGQPLFFKKEETDKSNQTPKLSHYQEAQTIINQHQGYGVLSTLSIKRKTHGYPSTSIVGFTTDETGYPIFCLSSIASHTLLLLNISLKMLMITEFPTQEN